MEELLGTVAGQSVCPQFVALEVGELHKPVRLSLVTSRPIIELSGVFVVSSENKELEPVLRLYFAERGLLLFGVAPTRVAGGIGRTHGRRTIGCRWVKAYFFVSPEESLTLKTLPPSPVGIGVPNAT